MFYFQAKKKKKEPKKRKFQLKFEKKKKKIVTKQSNGWQAQDQAHSKPKIKPMASPIDYRGRKPTDSQKKKKKTNTE